MKLIQKRNMWPIFCQSFTVVSLIGMCLDIMDRKAVNYSQFNMIMIAIGCMVAILVLSQTYRLEKFSPLVVLVIQYGAAAACIAGLVWLSGLDEPVHPHGYRDAVVTFSIPYLIGSAIYWQKLKTEIRRQDETLQMIKKIKEDAPDTVY